MRSASMGTTLFRSIFCVSAPKASLTVLSVTGFRFTEPPTRTTYNYLREALSLGLIAQQEGKFMTLEVAEAFKKGAK
jgi:hypothetical protein